MYIYNITPWHNNNIYPSMSISLVIKIRVVNACSSKAMFDIFQHFNNCFKVIHLLITEFSLIKFLAFHL